MQFTNFILAIPKNPCLQEKKVVGLSTNVCMLREGGVGGSNFDILKGQSHEIFLLRFFPHPAHFGPIIDVLGLF